MGWLICNRATGFVRVWERYPDSPFDPLIEEQIEWNGEWAGNYRREKRWDFARKTLRDATPAEIAAEDDNLPENIRAKAVAKAKEEIDETIADATIHPKVAAVLKAVKDVLR